MSYNVFIDDRVTGRNVETVSTDRIYDASAVANLMSDRGFRVYTDLWSDGIANAMVSPQVYERYGLGRTALLGKDA